VTLNATAVGREKIAGSAPSISRLLPLLPVLLATVNFFWQLGSPSLHIDEAFSWSAADSPLGDLLHQVRVIETAPWTYYLGLHGWIGLLGSDDEWVMRLPSALAGVALVPVTYRIGLLALGRRPALLAATLVAASPLVLTYAQQVRAYAFAMLLVAIAVWAALEAARAERRRQRAWLGVLVACSIGAFWLHYTTALVLVPLYVWVLLGSGLERRRALTVAGAMLLGSLPLLPLMLDQLSRGHEAGVAPSARLTAEHALRVLATPYDGRSERLTVWLALGAAALVVAFLLLAVTQRGRGRNQQVGLLLSLAITPVLAVTALTIFSDDVLISRYTAVAAPFLILVLAAGVAVAPRLAAPVIALVALGAGVGGSLDLHRSDGFHADVKGAFEAIGDRYRRGDVVLLRGYPAIGPIGVYYGGRELPRGAPLLVPDLIPAQKPALRQAIRDRRRLWSVDQLRLRPALRRGIVPRGYRRAGPRLRFPGAFDLQLTLAVPR
jgi:uncharacterized membrane protein